MLIDTSSFIVKMKTEDIYLDILKDVETRFELQIMNCTDHYRKEKIKK